MGGREKQGKRMRQVAHNKSDKPEGGGDMALSGSDEVYP